MFNRSAVAGIIDREGGFRVVITKRWQMRFHVGEGERLVVIPGLKVKEPIDWNKIPAIVALVEKYIKAQTDYSSSWR